MTEPLSRLTQALADRYRIDRELGAGGMATVYLAEDLKHHRNVALKVLKPELAAVVGADGYSHEALPLPKSDLAAPAIASGVNPNFCILVAPGAEAPKPLMPMIAPSSPT